MYKVVKYRISNYFDFVFNVILFSIPYWLGLFLVILKNEWLATTIISFFDFVIIIIGFKSGHFYKFSAANAFDRWLGILVLTIAIASCFTFGAYLYLGKENANYILVLLGMFICYKLKQFIVLREGGEG